jgi:N-acetylneuraminate synthase/N,N'-diacetyllegionaminate synthase
MEIKIENRIIGKNQPVFIIAEAGVNHNGSLDLAFELVDAAVKSGADAVKFQSFKTENIITPQAPKSTYHIETTGSKQSWFDLLKTQELDRTAHASLIDYCQQKNILFLSTPYDEESAEMLDEMNVPLYKVASTDLNNIPFLKFLARKKRPIILSTGMSTLAEVKISVDAIKNEACHDVVVLQCTSNYPTPLAETNLRAMATMANSLDVLVGYSDHTLDMINAIASIAMGAVVFEKHFTMDRNLAGPDHRMSIEPDELQELVDTIRKTELVLGSPEKTVTRSEEENRIKLRKSIVARTNIPSGTEIKAEMLTCKRPGDGIAPGEWDNIIGREARADIRENEMISHSKLK